MRSNILTKQIFSPLLAWRVVTPILFSAFVLALANVASAQIRPYGDSFRGGVNVPVSASVGQTVRLIIAVPDGGGDRANGGAHVRVFDGSSNMLFETSAVGLPGGHLHTFEIDPLQTLLVPDAVTGRLQLRIKVDLYLRNAVFDSNTVEFPTTFELVDNQTSKPVLIGLLLPAVQKVR